MAKIFSVFSCMSLKSSKLRSNVKVFMYRLIQIFLALEWNFYQWVERKELGTLKYKFDKVKFSLKTYLSAMKWLLWIMVGQVKGKENQ